MQVRIEDAGAFERFADAAHGVGEGFQLRDLILRQLAQEAEHGAQAGGNERPPFVKAELLILQPRGVAEAVEKLAGALARIAEGGAFILAEDDIGVALQHLADQRDGLRMRQSPGVTGDVRQPVRAIHIDRGGGAGQRAEKIPGDRAEEFFAEGWYNRHARKQPDGGWLGCQAFASAKHGLGIPA